MTNEKRLALIAVAKNAIGASWAHEDLKAMAGVALAALTAPQPEPFGFLRVVSGRSFQIMEGSQRPPDRSGDAVGAWFAIYTAPPARQVEKFKMLRGLHYAEIPEGYPSPAEDIAHQRGYDHAIRNFKEALRTAGIEVDDE